MVSIFPQLQKASLRAVLLPSVARLCEPSPYVDLSQREKPDNRCMPLYRLIPLSENSQMRGTTGAFVGRSVSPAVYGHLDNVPHKFLAMLHCNILIRTCLRGVRPMAMESISTHCNRLGLSLVNPSVWARTFNLKSR